MKTFGTALFFIVLMIIVLAVVIKPVEVDAGTEAVLIKKPWFFGHGGVEPIPVKTGLVWTVRTTQSVAINLKPYNIDEIFDDLVTMDNNPVDFKIHLTFKNIEGMTPILVESFGAQWYKNKVREPLRNTSRSFTKNHKMFDMTTSSKTTLEMEKIVTSKLREFLKKENIPVELTKVTVGKVMPPLDVIRATIATAVQKQNVKTQNERVKAEMSRTKAEKASAQADRTYAKTFGMTPNQYLEMKRLENQRLAITGASEGKINMSLIMGNAQPMFNITK